MRGRWTTEAKLTFAWILLCFVGQFSWNVWRVAREQQRFSEQQILEYGYGATIQTGSVLPYCRRRTHFPRLLAAVFG